MRRGHQKDMLGIWVRPDRVPYWEGGGWHRAPEVERLARENMDEIRVMSQFELQKFSEVRERDKEARPSPER